jgi:hypothetical protein
VVSTHLLKHILLLPLKLTPPTCAALINFPSHKAATPASAVACVMVAGINPMPLTAEATVIILSPTELIPTAVAAAVTAADDTLQLLIKRCRINQLTPQACAAPCASCCCRLV